LQLNLDKLELDTKWILSGKNSFLYFERIPTTIDIALEKFNQEKNQGKIVIADFQEKGRGSFSKSWHSSPYKDLTFSIILGYKNQFNQNLVDEACYAIKNFLQLYKVESIIKAPNDILIGKKKLAGVLLSKKTINNLSFQTLSIGININSSLELKNYPFEATSLCLEIGNEVERESCLVEIINQIDGAIKRQIAQ
jgi:BirA family biotin operon repressor/biotin-[acetyl-CoA-carboxylase] ligase